METSPEIGKTVVANGIKTNLHDLGSGTPVVLLHGSGPGVTAWANWRLLMPELAKKFRVIAPDLVGFGYTERPAGVRYEMDVWIRHAIGVLDALGLEKVGLVGNSFGGALALHLANHAPERFSRIILMGSVGVRFELTPGLNKAWGYTPSLENMREIINFFAYDKSLISDALVESRYKASIRPGIQEAWAAMFPAPRQRWIDLMVLPEERIRALPHEFLIFHGREDQIIPVACAQQLFELIPRAQLHLFGRCGHWTQIEHAARFNRMAVDFFSE
jgi:2-hydroxymuconate-semialdehyde hydrolase